MAYNDISNTADVLDSRDIIARVEALRAEREDFEHDDDGNLTGAAWSDSGTDDAAELATLEAFLAELCGAGGDEEWEGDWYPVTLVRDSYFTEYAQELVEDIGDMPNSVPSYIVVDWDATARNIRNDYTSAEFDGVTYWFR